MVTRQDTKSVKVGCLTIGGGSPVSVQSMTNVHTHDAKACLTQIERLADAGADLVRLAVPTAADTAALKEIVPHSPVPLIADVHFHFDRALESITAGVAKIRLNPGNIADTEQIAMIVRMARERQVPIRIGVNAGSLPRGLQSEIANAELMVQAALQQVHFLESLDFDLIKVSLKAFDVPTTIEAYRSIAGKIPYPLHLGITEAGLPQAGAIRSAVAMGALLYMGIGDTIRVSLTGPPHEEVATAYEILKSLNLRQRGPTLVSCPTCGRCEVELIRLAKAVDEHLAKLDKPVKVAVMGCVVNGPGEARDADLGIACGRGKGVIFKKGEVVGTVEETDFLNALMAELASL